MYHIKKHMPSKFIIFRYEDNKNWCKIKLTAIPVGH